MQRRLDDAFQIEKRRAEHVQLLLRLRSGCRRIYPKRVSDIAEANLEPARLRDTTVDEVALPFYYDDTLCRIETEHAGRGEITGHDEQYLPGHKQRYDTAQNLLMVSCLRAEKDYFAAGNIVYTARGMRNAADGLRTEFIHHHCSVMPFQICKVILMYGA